MKPVILIALAMPISSAYADSRCIALRDSVLSNQCASCTEVTVRAVRPRGEQAAGPFTGESRTVRLEGGAREALQGHAAWAISDLRTCN